MQPAPVTTTAAPTEVPEVKDERRGKLNLISNYLRVLLLTVVIVRLHRPSVVRMYYHVNLSLVLVAGSSLPPPTSSLPPSSPSSQFSSISQQKPEEEKLDNYFIVLASPPSHQTRKCQYYSHFLDLF